MECDDESDWPKVWSSKAGPSKKGKPSSTLAPTESSSDNLRLTFRGQSRVTIYLSHVAECCTSLDIFWITYNKTNQQTNIMVHMVLYVIPESFIAGFFLHLSHLKQILFKVICTQQVAMTDPLVTWACQLDTLQSREVPLDLKGCPMWLLSSDFGLKTAKCHAV